MENSSTGELEVAKPEDPGSGPPSQAGDHGPDLNTRDVACQSNCGADEPDEPLLTSLDAPPPSPQQDQIPPFNISALGDARRPADKPAVTSPDAARFKSEVVLHKAPPPALPHLRRRSLVEGFSPVSEHTEPDVAPPTAGAPSTAANHEPPLVPVYQLRPQQAANTFSVPGQEIIYPSHRGCSPPKTFLTPQHFPHWRC